jgi:hypothetical protein
MTDPSPNLVLEQLRHIRATTDKIASKQIEHEQHLIEIRLQLASLIREDAIIHARLAEHEARFERIEARLNLNDAE